MHPEDWIHLRHLIRDVVREELERHSVQSKETTRATVTVTADHPLSGLNGVREAAVQSPA